MSLGQGTDPALLGHSHVLVPLSHFLSSLCKPRGFGFGYAKQGFNYFLPPLK